MTSRRLKWIIFGFMLCISEPEALAYVQSQILSGFVGMHGSGSYTTSEQGSKGDTRPIKSVKTQGRGKLTTKSKSQVYSELIELEITNMKKAVYVFEIKPSMNIDDVQIPVLRVSVSKNIQDLLKAYNVVFANNTGNIKLSNFVETRLNSSDFEIKALSKSQQTVSSQKDLVWEWEIKPKKEGQLKTASPPAS